MTRTPPAWVDGRKPDVAEEYESKLRQQIAAGRLHQRGVGSLPLDREHATWELIEEQRALRSIRPRTRKWRALERLDVEVDRLNAKLTEARARVQDAEQAVQDAPRHDAETLAGWISAGEKGERPAPTLYERERDRDAARLLVEAVQVELDQVLARRFQYIDKHRESMVKDARRDVDAARTQLLAQLAALPALREALVDARETMLWAASYPDRVESWGFPTVAALGLRKPIEQILGTKGRVEHSALIQALEKDADALADTFGPETKQRLGIADPKTPEDAAVWWDDAGDADLAAWKKAELERARRLAEWSTNPNQVAAEARDLRS